jgi:cell wall-associated NlpC family hydrolase
VKKGGSVAKGRQLFVGLGVVTSLLVAFGCAPKKIQVYPSVPAPQVRDQLVQYAATLLGKPYRNGAKGPEAFDCSGFVYYVYRRFDIRVPVSTEGLNRIGYEIARDDVLVGDLVVFRIRREHHVGIMMNRADFIHASKSRGVAVDNVDAAYWKRNFLNFRRIL